MPRVFVPATKANWLVTIESLPVYWETFSGVDEQSETSQYSDGYNRDLLTLVGPAQLQTFVFTRGYDPEQDDDIVTFWKQARGAGRTQTPKTVSIQAVEYTPEPVAVGSPITIYNFKATRFSFGEVDKSSQESSLMTLEGVGTYWDKRATTTPLEL